MIRKAMAVLRAHADAAVCWENKIVNVSDGSRFTQNLLDCVAGQTWQLETFRFRSHDLEASALLNNIASSSSRRKEISILWDGENIELSREHEDRVRVCRRLRVTVRGVRAREAR